MTDYQTETDTVGILLPAEWESLLRDHLQQQFTLDQLDQLTQAVTEITSHMQVQPTIRKVQLVASPRYGCPMGWQNFVLMCEVFFMDFPDMMDQQRISALIQWLTGHVQEWAVAIWWMGGTQPRIMQLFYRNSRTYFITQIEGSPAPNATPRQLLGGGLLYHILYYSIEPLGTLPQQTGDPVRTGRC